MVNAYQTGGSVCSIIINRENNTIVKEVNINEQGADNGYDKLLYEAKHIKEENEKGSTYFPQVLSIEHINDELLVTYQFLYDGTTFADLLRNENISFEYIKNSLEYILNDLSRNFYIKTNHEPDPCYLKKWYLNRINRRMDSSLKLLDNLNLKWKELKKALECGVIINGEYYPSIYKYMDYIASDKKILNDLKIHNTYESHHDLIFANILVEVTERKDRINNFKLIDPRGRGETGGSVRHYMYDFGKMLLGFDCYDIFRSKFRADKRNNFIFKKEIVDGLYSYTIKFDHSDILIQKYMASQNIWWENIHRLQKESGLFSDVTDCQIWFSFAHMYHPDIPCRMMSEGKEELAMYFYIRGMIILRHFMDLFYGKDPLRLPNENNEIDLWPSI